MIHSVLLTAQLWATDVLTVAPLLVWPIMTVRLGRKTR